MTILKQGMDFDKDNVRLLVEQDEDRLSRLPNEVIHKIISCIDMKFAIQMCLLSTRWKLVWTSMPCLNFSNGQFHGDLCKFDEFVTNVLSHRKQQVQVSSVKLHFDRESSQVIVRKIADYAFSHNVQELSVAGWAPKTRHEYKFPLCLFSSQSLKHFKLHTCCTSPCNTPTTPWDFPALTTLHLSKIILCHQAPRESLDLFSKCVNLKDLTLKDFDLTGTEVFDIITPGLSNLILISGSNLKFVNVIAPQLENLTIINTQIQYLNAPAGVSSLCYKGYDPPLQLSKDRFHSLNQVNICLSFHSCLQSSKNDARKTINILQELHCAKYLTLNTNIIKCISLFPDLLSHHPSPFNDLISLSMDSNGWPEDAYKIKMCTEARNFLFQNCPNAMFTMELPEEPPQPIHRFEHARKYTFIGATVIVDDKSGSKKKNKKKMQGKKKNLSRLDAIIVIQMAFRAFVIRRWKGLRALRELAVAKGELIKLRAY